MFGLPCISLFLPFGIARRFSKIVFWYWRMYILVQFHFLQCSRIWVYPHSFCTCFWMHECILVPCSVTHHENMNLWRSLWGGGRETLWRLPNPLVPLQKPNQILMKLWGAIRREFQKHLCVIIVNWHISLQRLSPLLSPPSPLLLKAPLNLSRILWTRLGSREGWHLLCAKQPEIQSHVSPGTRRARRWTHSGLR